MSNQPKQPLKNGFPWALLICAGALALLIISSAVVLDEVFGADITSGYTFSSGEQNIDHTKLNSVLSGASINATFFTDKSAATPTTSDTLLFVQSGSFKKATLANLVFNHDQLINGRSATVPATNDYFLFYDTSASAYGKAPLTDVVPLHGSMVAHTNLHESDQFLVYDSQAETNKKVSLTNLFGANISDHKDLVVSNSSAAAVQITADSIFLRHTDNIHYWLARGVNVTAAITSSGAGGLDTGSEAASTWYYIWLIWNGTTVSGLLSTSADTPTMPSGYTYKCLAGVVRNDSSSDFVNFHQYGTRVFTKQVTIFTGKIIGTANTWEAYTSGGGGPDVDFATLVPAIARSWSGMIGRTDTTAADTLVQVSGLATAGGTAAALSGTVLVNFPRAVVGTAAVGGLVQMVPFSDVPLCEAQKFYWRSVTKSTVETAILINGYVIAL